MPLTRLTSQAIQPPQKGSTLTPQINQALLGSTGTGAAATEADRRLVESIAASFLAVLSELEALRNVWKAQVVDEGLVARSRGALREARLLAERIGGLEGLFARTIALEALALCSEISELRFEWQDDGEIVFVASAEPLPA